jgi:antitoxin MazE
MYLLMKTRLVSMGNSRGVRLPKPLIEQVGLVDEVEISVENGAIVIAPLRALRSGWGEAAARLRAESSDGLIDPPVRSRFDEDEWRW